MTTSTTPPTSSEQPARKKALGLPMDILLLVAVGGLLAFGLMMVYSSTFDWSYRQYGDPSTIFWRQVQWLGVGLVALFITSRMKYQWWKTLIVPVMGLTLIALLGVLLIGTTTFNAQRSFFQGSVQPSELAKLVTIIYLAVWLASKGDKIREMSYGIIPFALIVGVVTGLILLQPDLSAAATVVIVSTLMFFIAGADILQMVLVAGVGSAAAWAVVQASETGRARLTDYLAGVQDITQASWHVQQAAIAFVNGGIFGRGLGESRQKFGFLPTPHTDSIFAIIGEELGLVGCLFVIALFVALVWRGFKIASVAREPLGALLSAGIISWVAIEALINIAVMVGAMPFAGNALPFISYGGSNLVVSLIGMGTLLNISRVEQEESLQRKTRPAPTYTARGLAKPNAAFNFSRRDRRGRLSRSGDNDRPER